MSDTTTAGPVGEADEYDDMEPASLAPFLAYAREALGAGSSFATLLQLELRLAAGDLGRLVFLGLLTLPILLLAWIGLGTTVSWLLFELTGIPLVAFVTFFALQLITLGFIAILARRFSKSLGLPQTTHFIRTAAQRVQNESQEQDQ